MRRRDFTKASLASLGAFAVGSVDRAGAWWGRAAVPGRVNGDRLNQHLAALSEFGKNSFGGVSRVAYSDFDRSARAYVMGVMKAGGLTVSVDAAGNIWGRRAGREPSRRPIVFGSHIDSVPEGGNFDGTVGSLGAIEVAQTLAEQRLVTRHPLEVVIFQNEEGGTVGSRALVGELHDADLSLKTRSGKTIGEGIAFLGGDVQRLTSVRRAPGDCAAYVELHIEQGGTLEKESLDIGVVQGIVGISQWEVTVTGFQNHAGTTVMADRKDALLAAARFIDMVHREVTSVPGRQVGTVGRIEVIPGAPNVIPGKVVCSLELRDLDAAKVAALAERIRAEAARIGEATGTTFAYADLHHSTPALCDERVKGIVERAAGGLSLRSKHLPSGAGHDAQHMAKLCPAGMIFIPSVGGISHSPREFSHARDITNGANVLLATVLAIDEAPWS